MFDPTSRALSPVRLALVALAVVATLAIGLLAPYGASAHIVFQGAEPPADSVVAEVPATVSVLMSGEIAETGSTLTVAGPDGATADAGDGRLDLNDLDRRTLTVTLLPDLPDGTYTVTYTAFPTDGHEAAVGSYTFTVGAATDAAVLATPAATPGATPAGTPAATPIAVAGVAQGSTNDDGRGLTSILLVIAAGALVIFGAGVAVTRGARRHRV